jgi:hypothetical protein
MSACPICAGPRTKAFRATVLGRHDADFLHCEGCGFVGAESPHWLAEAYQDAIAVTDTGIVQRNLWTARRLAPLLYFGLDPGRPYLDLAGGYGLLVRAMRDLGFDFYWDDPHAPNLVARGFEAGDAPREYAAVTAFEVLEHVPDPLSFVAGALARARTRTLVFSTELYRGTAPPPPDWWYYSFDTGQHISFFAPRTIETLGRRLSLSFQTFHGLHVLSERPLPAGRLRLATGRLAPLATEYVRRRLGSRTWPDHERALAGLRSRPT